jgi:thiol-disulfide isomerase/thioredoxin
MKGLFFLPLLVFAVLAGCSGETAAEGPAPRSANPAPTRSPLYEPVAMTRDWSAEPQLVHVTHEQWRRELEAMHGRVVVVDNWATGCKPCIERFPAMLELEKKWGPHGVMFVTLSLDDRDDPHSVEQVRGFLTEQDARIPNYLMDEMVADAFDKLGLLGLPAVFIYDQSGTMVHRLTGDDPNRQLTEEDVDKAVHALVGNQSSV